MRTLIFFKKQDGSTIMIQILSIENLTLEPNHVSYSHNGKFIAPRLWIKTHGTTIELFGKDASDLFALIEERSTPAPRRCFACGVRQAT